MKTISMLLIAALFCGCKMFRPLQSFQQSVADGEPLVTQTIHEGDLTIYNIEKFNTTIVRIPHISSYLFLQHPEKSVEEIAVDNNFALTINASYFDMGKSGYEHAGYLKINNRVLAPYKEDRQIMKLFAYNGRKKRAACFDMWDTARTKGDDLVVQTGPQIICKNRIDSASIRQSINGNMAKIRTAFAVVNDTEFYVIIVRDEITLYDLGRLLMHSNVFRGELDVINFDGGPSTVLYIKNHPEIGFHSNRTLPVLIGVR